MDKILIILIDKNQESIDRLSRLLNNIEEIEITHTSINLEDLGSLIIEKVPSAVIIGPTYTLIDIENFLTSQNLSLGLVKVILLVIEPSPSIFKKAIKLNIFDVLEFPFNYKDIKESISRVSGALKELAGEKIVSVEEKAKLRTRLSKNIMIFSTKGGTGKSFIATNLAIDIYNQTKKNVVLVDLNYQSGDVALILDLVPKHTVFDISSIVKQLDTEMLKSYLTSHSSGIKVLPAPVDPTQSESISSKTTLKIVDTLTKICDYLVIDAPPNFSENILSLLDQIDFLCMVSSMDVLSLKNLKVSLEVLEQLKFPDEKIITIINRSNTKVGIAAEEIDQILKKKIDIAVPSDRTVPLSINQGNPIVIGYPKSVVSKSINKLTKIIITDKGKLK